METLKRYETKIAVETRLRNSMYSMYKKFWPFISKTTCSERTALTSYKNTSDVINSILWLPEEVETLRSVVVSHLLRTRVSVSFFRDSVIEYLTKELAIIKTLENLFLKAPSTTQETIVFRGIKSKYSGIYEKLQVGDRFTIRNFLSTSFNFDTALNFGKYMGGSGIVTVIKLPKGTKYLLLPGSVGSDFTDVGSFKEFLGNTVYARDEMELLLNKNLTFEVLKIKKKMRITPSVDYMADKYLDSKFVQLYTLRLVDRADTKFEQTAPDIADIINSVSIRINEQII